MSLLDKIREGLLQGTEKLVEKGRKVGSDGVDATREIFTHISEKTTDVTAMARLKYEIAGLPKQLDNAFLNIGKVVLDLHRKGQLGPQAEALKASLAQAAELDDTLKAKQSDYEALRKKHSGDYVINKLSEDLSSAGAIIDQVIVSDQSNVVNKLLKELLLPKEALVSAIKRREEVIIPDGNTKLLAGDQVIVIGKKDDVAKVAKRLAAQ